MQRYRGAVSSSTQPQSPEKMCVAVCDDYAAFRERVVELDELVGAVREAARVRIGDGRRDRRP